jgi:hypothetical protein
MLLTMPQLAQADNYTIPWMTGFFNAGSSFFVMMWGPDSYASLGLNPDLPDMTPIWTCYENGVCQGTGGGAIYSGSAGGEIRSNFDGTLHYTFSGLVTGGFASRQAQYCPDQNVCLSYWFDTYYILFDGSWTNGWLTTGSSFGYDGSESGSSGTFLLETTSIPEPATLTLIGLGLTGVYLRARRR